MSNDDLKSSSFGFPILCHVNFLRSTELFPRDTQKVNVKNHTRNGYKENTGALLIPKGFIMLIKHNPHSLCNAEPSNGDSRQLKFFLSLPSWSGINAADQPRKCKGINLTDFFFCVCKVLTQWENFLNVYDKMSFERCNTLCGSLKCGLFDRTWKIVS